MRRGERRCMTATDRPPFDPRAVRWTDGNISAAIAGLQCPQQSGAFRRLPSAGVGTSAAAAWAPPPQPHPSPTAAARAPAAAVCVPVWHPRPEQKQEQVLSGRAELTLEGRVKYRAVQALSRCVAPASPV